MAEVVVSKEVALERLAAAQAARKGEKLGSESVGAVGQIELHPQWPLLSQMPMKLDVAVPMPGFKVRDLLALGAGQTLATLWRTSEDVPLKIGGVQFAWSEFEVVEQRMAVRLTRLG
jgi:flagellar motor switch protein FliN/FliY